MNLLNKSIWIVGLFFATFIVNAAVLKDGTDIAVRLAENVNGNINSTGETIYFQVTEDVKVNGQLVIEAGTFVKGMVNEAVGRKSMGKGGVLTLVPRSLKTQHGDLVKFERNPLSQEGRKRTGATVAHVVMWGPLGLFAKGRAAFMFRETEFDITVDGDYELPAISKLMSKSEGSGTNDVQITFAKYKSKINYRKGKLGKDFTVHVTDSSDYDINEIEITAVDGHILPEPIKPISISDNKKDDSQKKVVFSFLDIVKYALPESSDFDFKIGESHQGNAQLVAKWKLK